MKRFVHDESGAALLLVLILLFMGSLVLTPTLASVFTANRSGQIQERVLKDQYARDGGSEYAVWELLHGGATGPLVNEGDETEFPLNLNGINSIVRVRLQAELGDNVATGAEGNKIRLSSSVVCEISAASSAFDDPCDSLPEQANMRAKYTVFLDQVSPDTSEPIVAVYDQLPSKFDWDPVADPVVSLDATFTEIESITPTNIGSSQDQIWKWDFSAAPLSFVQGQVRQFTFIAEMDQIKGEYCNRIFTKMQAAPHESSAPESRIFIDDGQGVEGCANGGTLVAIYVDQIIALPGATTIFTYIVNVENNEKNSQQIDGLKSVLPQAGFLFCNGPTVGDPTGPDCDPPMFLKTDTDFDPSVPANFTSTVGYTNMSDPTETYDAVTDRWTLEWDAGWSMEQAGKDEDTFIMRFQAEFTPVESGSFYIEIFADVDCSVPSALTSSPNDVTSQSEYCASYSWPSGGSLVPTYDVVAFTDYSAGWGNITVGGGTGQLESWHVEDDPPN